MLDVRIEKKVWSKDTYNNKSVSYYLYKDTFQLGFMAIQYPKIIGAGGREWIIPYCNGLRIVHDYRDKGLGTFFVSEIQKQFKKPIGLACLEDKVAFYKRLGFELLSKEYYYNQMEWHP